MSTTEENPKALDEAVYEIDHDYESEFCMLNDAIFTNKTSIQFVGLNSVINDTGLGAHWIVKIMQSIKIGEAMDRIPFGILDKTITGLGATTLELMNQIRNSIIVVPTKSLAYIKNKIANQIKGEDYSFYVGSSIKDIKRSLKESHIIRYLETNPDQKKKFLVVADSLPLVINAIQAKGVNVYEDYFLMVDEIDTMQTDSVFRPKLETVMDFYFKFNRCNRSVVTATLSDFSNPDINLESKITTVWEKPIQRDIKLIYTNYVDDVAIKLISEFTAQSQEKILIAYNSLDGIFNIIKQLDTELQNDCGILCSERSYDKVRRYLEHSDDEIDESGNLQKRIVFMTCAYFAGIDIMDQCHLISITSHLQPFTYLSTNRLAQIAGRARNGNLSETIIYDIPLQRIPIERPIDDYKKDLIKKAQALAKVINSWREAVLPVPELEPLLNLIDSYVDYHATAKVGNYESTKIIRQNYFSKEFVPAFFNIDAILERWNLANTLYSHKDNIKNELSEYHKVTSIDVYISQEEHDITALTEIKDLNDETRLKTVEEAEIFLQTWSIPTNNQYLDRLCEYNDRKLSSYFKAFRRLFQFIERQRLLEDLKENFENQKKLRNYINSAVFWALDERHPFKLKVLAEFGINDINLSNNGIRITSAQKREKLLESFRSQYSGTHFLTTPSSTDFFKAFFKTRRGSMGRFDVITGLNPRAFEGEPLTRISSSVNILDAFIFPNSQI